MTHKDDEVALGASKWRVYKGTGSGFGAPIDLALPTVGATGSYTPFASLSGEDNLTDGASLTHWTVDFDGDGKLDLLVTHKDDEVALGASKWRVYKGTGSGFGAPIDLALPTVGATGSYTPFASLSGEDNLTDGASLTHWTVDVDGDGKLDILATHKDGEAALGASKWRLYKGTGTGFAAPIDVALPSVGATGSYTPFASLSGEDNLTDGASLTHWTVDVDGDGKLDILATHKDGEAALGASKWRFYKGTGTGFGAPVDLALPNVGATGSYTPFASLGGGDNLTNGAILTHWTVDVDGDRALDLLATHKDGDTALGASKWIVFRATCQ